jgi:hypothetical protein
MACNVRCWQTLPLRCTMVMSRWATNGRTQERLSDDLYCSSTSMRHLSWRKSLHRMLSTTITEVTGAISDSTMLLAPVNWPLSAKPQELHRLCPLDERTRNRPWIRTGPPSRFRPSARWAGTILHTGGALQGQITSQPMLADRGRSPGQAIRLARSIVNRLSPPHAGLAGRIVKIGTVVFIDLRPIGWNGCSRVRMWAH